MAEFECIACGRVNYVPANKIGRLQTFKHTCTKCSLTHEVAVIDGTVKKAEPLIMDADKKRKGSIKGIGKYVYWDFEGLWVGYFEKYPEHWSQGETIAELREGLLKIHDLIMRGELQ